MSQQRQQMTRLSDRNSRRLDALAERHATAKTRIFDRMLDALSDQQLDQILTASSSPLELPEGPAERPEKPSEQLEKRINQIVRRSLKNALDERLPASANYLIKQFEIRGSLALINRLNAALALADKEDSDNG